ncbi:hypothetical protein yc1106_07241 [Curvularia clavata]|uniref:PQ loop repeat protein n=1 Tax=Curvularia clavata TaxID=95742 RepID=A0A9Q8ZDC2_CURCL|nr:hypothetical protein yc1106_07241 [Curvularia clavata]
MDIPVAANVLGTMGAVCWSIQLIPQIIVNYRRHNATGLQPTMMMLWAWAGVPLGVYNIAEDFNVALRIQPQILTALSLVTWIQCYYYEKNWSVSRSLAVVGPIACLMGAVQTGLIFAIRHAKSEGLHWPSILMAVTSAALLAAGVLRHYIDVYLFRTVRGISFIFVGIDALGDVFSLASVVFQPTLDILGIVIYGTELVLWIGIFMTRRAGKPHAKTALTVPRISVDMGMDLQRHLGSPFTVYPLALQSSGRRRVICKLCNRALKAYATFAIETAAISTIMGLKKITSLDCQSEGPSAPAPSVASEYPSTPVSGSVDPPPEMDFDAVARVLGPLADALNEAALEASYPSPPNNTPAVGSPADSILSRYPRPRGRGHSNLGDRSFQMKPGNRNLHCREADVRSNNYSPEAFIAENEQAEIVSISGALSDSDMNKQGPGSAVRSHSPISVTSRVVPFILGSPASNPLIEEYLSFTSNDLPTKSVAPCLPSTLMETGAVSIKTAVNGSSEHNAFSEGVTEKTNWAEEVEEAVERVCLRLEQLADDEFKSDPSKSIEEYYVARLQRLLGGNKRKVPVHVHKVKTAHQ